MESKDSAEAIDFDFFDDDDREPRYAKKTTSNRDRYDDDSARRYDRHDRPSSGRPDSVRSTASSRSSLSVKIPSANPSPRDNISSSDDEDNYSPKQVNGYDKYDKRKDKKNRSRSNSGESEHSKSTRPKTSKGSRSRYSSGSSSASKSSRSSVGSRSSKSDDSSSHSSDSESVTDVSPMQSPMNSRSPSPARLRYNDEEMDSSPESRDVRNKNKRKQLKDSVRFEEPPRGGRVRPSASERSTRLAATEAQELSMLLKAVLEMEETPARPNFHDFEGGVRSRPSSGKRPMSGKAMPHQRMNMSFSNDEVRRIDKDNQRLLQNIINPPSSVPGTGKRPQSGRTRTRSASYGSRPRPSSGHISHSALLRQKEQRRIEMENLKILQRIEGAKPTSELQYQKLKKDFNKQQQYAAQVSRTPVRPSSAKRTGKFPSGHSGGMSKASSMQSLRSDITTTSTSSRNRSRPSSGRPSWDDHWTYT